MRNRLFGVISALCLVAGAMLFSGASQAKPTGRFAFDQPPGRPQLSGVADPSIQEGNAANDGSGRVARAAGTAASDDIQVNADNKYDPAQQFGSGEGWPQNETSIAINPTDPNNVIGGANDYEPAVDSVMGIYTSMNGGKTWLYSRHARRVITPDRQVYGSGDPVIAFDSEGTAYASFIAFGRANCDSYIGVIRSTDKGVTWSTPVDSVPEGSGLSWATE